MNVKSRAKCDENHGICIVSPQMLIEWKENKLYSGEIWQHPGQIININIIKGDKRNHVSPEVGHLSQDITSPTQHSSQECLTSN